MKNSIKTRKGQETLSIAPRVMRPLAVIAACLAMALVVLPTAGVAVASNYNDDDNGGRSGNTVAKVALISAGVFALIYAVTRGNDDDDQ